MRIPNAIRPVVLLALANGIADAAIVPLLPAIRDEFGLSGVELGVLLALPTAVSGVPPPWWTSAD